jgi:hypothetical protein
VSGIPAEPFDLPTASGVIVAGRLLVMGVFIGESTGAATAKVRFRDGSAVTGTRLTPYTLAANESVRDWFGDYGYVYQQGVFMELVSGSVEGSIMVVPESSLGPAGFAKLVAGLIEGVESVR